MPSNKVMRLTGRKRGEQRSISGPRSVCGTKATVLAAISRYQFAGLVARRGVPRHYGADELAEDLAYGRGE